MSPQILGPVRPIALLGVFLVSTAGAGLTTQAAYAKECLTAPKAQTPKGGHWYYRTDRVLNRKCWYLRVADQPAQPKADATQPNAAPVTDAAPAPPPPAKQSADSVWSAAPAGPQTAVIGSATTGSAPNATPTPQAEAASDATPIAPANPVSVWPQQTGQPADTTSAAATVSRDQPQSAESSKAATPAVPPRDAGPETIGASAAPPATVGAANTAATHPAAAPAANANPGKTINPAETAFASATTPLGILLIVALALALSGILYRILPKMLALRGPRVILDRSGYEWDQHRYDEAPIVPRQVNVERTPTLVPAVTEPNAGRPRHRREEWPRDGGGSRIVPAKHIRQHEERLAALMRDLDQLLQTRNGK